MVWLWRGSRRIQEPPCYKVQIIRQVIEYVRKKNVLKIPLCSLLSTSINPFLPPSLMYNFESIRVFFNERIQKALRRLSTRWFELSGLSIYLVSSLNDVVCKKLQQFIILWQLI